MRPGMMELMRKHFSRGMPMPSEEEIAEPGGLPGVDYTATIPDGEVDVSRAPLVAAKEAPEESDLLDELSTPLTDEERAGLGDKRASASRVAARNDFDDMSNIFLSGGRAPIQQRPDEFKTERDEMRDWVMKRGGIARSEKTNDLNADRTGAYLAATQAQQARAAAAAEQAARKEGRLEEAERLKAERLKLEDDRKRLESERDQRNKDRDFGLKKDAEKRNGAGPKLGPDGKPIPSIQERRQVMKENAIKPRPGWEPIDEKAPTFRDVAQAKEFDDSAAAFGAVQNHKHHALEALKQFRNAKTLTEKDNAMGVLNAQMGALASRLRKAEGLNNTDSANHAIDKMLSLVDGNAVNPRNLANESRLETILDAAMESAGANLDTLGASANIRRSKVEGGGTVMVQPKDKSKPPRALDLATAKKVLADPKYEEVK